MTSTKNASAPQPRVCIGCGCTRKFPCYVQGGGTCTWARISQEDPSLGVCSNCRFTIDYWDSVMAKQTEPSGHVENTEVIR